MRDASANAGSRRARRARPAIETGCYEILEQSSQRWHEGKHDPWPTMNFRLFILTQACRECEERVEELKAPRGEQTALIEAAIARAT